MSRRGSRHATLALAGRIVRAVVLAAALAACIGRPADGQALRFRHLRSDDGLAAAWVQAIAQDGRGFMWFGTAQGLNRYDGYAMSLFRHDKNDPRSIGDNSVNAIREDGQGALWIGTRAGLSRYDRARNDFTNFSLRDAGDESYVRQVMALLADSRGTLWIGSTEGLYQFDRRLGKPVPFVLPAPADRAEQHIKTVYEDRRGHILIGTATDGMFDYDPVAKTHRHLAHQRPGALDFPSNEVQSFIEDRRGRLWVGTYESGLVLLDPATGRYTAYRHDPRDPASPTNDHLSYSALDHSGKIWVSALNGGLELFDPETRTFRHLRADPDDPNGLSSDSFWSVFVDDGGTLWAGSFSGGVDVLRPATGAIERFVVIPNDSTSLSHDAVVGFAQDSTGTMWIATDGGGLNRLDPVTGRIHRYTTKNSNINRDAVLSASVDARGRIWTAYWDGGISELDPATGRFTSYTRKNTNLPEDNIFSVLVDSRQRIWVGSHEHGLLRFDPATRSFTELPYGEPGGQSQIWIIREMRDGRLLLGTLQNGLVVFDPATNAMTRYSAEAGSPLVLASSDIRAILEERPGVLWIGTAAGLDRLDLTVHGITHFTVKDGLPSDMIAGLALDRTGGMWVATDRGIALWDPARRSARTYTPDDGLQAREFTARSYLTGRDGALMFGGNQGFNVIRPELIERNMRKPRIAFTGFQLFNRPVVIGARGSPLRTHITEAKEIRLDHTQSVFTIEFAALDLTASAKNQYAYKLEGFDHDWTYSGGARSATYTNLRPAHYVFRVRASNNDGVWNDEGAAIDVVITPPFWATWWFRTLVGLVIIGVVAAIVRSAQLRHRRLQAMNEQLGRANEQLGRAAEHDRESQQYLEGNVLDILGAMQKFSAGDYSVALAVRSEDAIGKLRFGFNSVVADRKRAEEELRQSQKMEAVGRLAGGVAHDFNNLLTVIKGNAELALADLEENDVVREELEEIERASERASSLTRQLLAFSRKQILKPQVISLNEMVAEVARMLRRTVGEDIELCISLDPELGMVCADPGQLEQVVLNLVVNARDAMPRGGLLRIETRNVEPERVRELAEAEQVPYVAIVVSDNGTGMTAEVKDRVFEPFYTTKEQGKGTGLGLSTVYGSVKQSGGFVVVESELDVGSSFSIYLPRVAEAEEQRATAEQDSGPAGSATVLLVEDEDAVRRLASRVLVRAGYTVLTASCGAVALEVAASHVGTIDLLMTDVVMPGMSGRVLAEQLMPLHPGMRLLYASGYTEDAIIRHGVSSQETAFLEKPFAPNALLRKVRQVLDASELLASRT